MYGLLCVLVANGEDVVSHLSLSQSSAAVSVSSQPTHAHTLEHTAMNDDGDVEEDGANSLSGLNMNTHI